MSRKPATFLALLLSAAIGMLAGGAGLVAAQTAADPSAVVLVFDVSNAILQSNDGTNIEFAAALDKIADRVGTIAADLTAGNATISFVAFGRKAIPYPSGCQRLQLHDDPAAVTRFEGCLRTIAADYQAGSRAPVRQRINTAGRDHFAALDEASETLPAGSVRSAVVFFAVGQNDPPGTARDHEDVVAKVTPAFAGRTPLAILPVGLGAGAGAFESELQAIYDAFIRDMAPCNGRASFSWPQVVFPSAEEAGAAVALGLQEVTCSFTVTPTPIPTLPPTATPALTATPTPTVAASPAVVAPACSAGLFECNPLALWVAVGGAVVAIVGGLLFGSRLYARRNRVWVTAQVDGGPNRPLGWGPRLGIGLDRDEGGWYAVKRSGKSAPIQVRYRGNNRFLVQSSAGVRDVHQGDPATVREGTGETHQLILRRYVRRLGEEAPARRAHADDSGEDFSVRLDRSPSSSSSTDGGSTPEDAA